MNQTILAVTILTLAPPAGVSPAPCSVQFVPTEKIAREIAQAIISGRMSAAEIAKYVLHVEEDEEDVSQWAAYQSPPDAGDGIITGGGGGIQMRIDKCNGRVSNLHYQR